MDDKIQALRQPMVTATGIILGFMLNFLAGWVKSDTVATNTFAYITGLCMLGGTALLVLCLFRILRYEYPRSTAKRYYNQTLLLFILGICLAFLGVFIDATVNLIVG
jgi:hypothetical protein